MNSAISAKSAILDADSVEFPDDRHFALWSYTVSHSQLVLVSVKSESFNTRLVILFKGVSFVSIPTRFLGFRASRDSAGSDRAPARTPTARSFAIAHRGGVGTIVASVMHAFEDEGEYYDPLPFDYSGLGVTASPSQES